MTKDNPPGSANARGRNLWSTALATTLIALLPAATAAADGGPGGPGAGGGIGGAPGTTSTSGTGGAGTDGETDSGGGGGGAGATGGAGGAGGGGGFPGGAGGAGGAHGHIGGSFATTPQTGTDGSAGGDGDSGGGGGGGGGAGGYGTVITSTGSIDAPLTNAVTGGAGGNGGTGGQFAGGGAGGNGGIGILFAAAGASATINANVTGGAFGIGGNGSAPFGVPTLDGPPGEPGAGIVGTDLSLTLGATVSGATIAGGATADALRFLGGVNRLTLGSGWGLNGAIFVDGILDLGQASDVTIDAQDTIFGFNNREIWGSGSLRFQSSGGTVTLNGENNYTGGTEIAGGRVAIGHMNALGTDTVLFSGTGGALTSNITGTLDNDITFDSTSGALGAAAGTTLTLGGALTQNAGSTTTFGSSTNTGTIAIDGAVSGTGSSIVGGGTLNLNGSVDGNLTVNSDATLSGNSTIGGDLTLNTGGFLASGNSIGTTTVLGNYIGGGTLNVEVQFGNAGAPVNGVTHDFLDITGDVSGTTTISPINFAPSMTPAATTGNGIQIVRVGGTTLGNAFTMDRYLLGNYNYDLAYQQDYSGTSDGFFLRSTLATPGCVVSPDNDNCFIYSTTNQATAVDALAGNDTLQLSGATNFDFNISGFGTTYSNFERLQKAGTSTVTLTGTAGSSALGIDLQDGRLVAGSNQLGANGAVNILAPGTLEVASALTVGSIAGAGSIDLGASLEVGGATTNTFSGVISGSGSLVRQGTGTTILTGANTYSGFTNIGSGTLQVGNGGTSGSLGTGAVNLMGTSGAGTIAFNRSDAVTVANVISGSGTLNQAGTGTTILTGANTYLGPTTISAGTLQIGNGGTAGSLGTGAVTNNGALAFNRSDAVTVANVISGTGIVDILRGTTTLTGDNVYTGATTIFAGTLQVGNGGTTGSLGTGAVANNGTLVLARSNALTVANAISGTGSLTQSGTGTTTLTGANTYSGGTTISAGTLQVGDGGTTGSLGIRSVTNNSSLVFNRSNTVTVANAISGTGSLTQSGTGTSVLTGANTYTGATTISSGTLEIGNGGTAGSLGTGAVTNNGTLAINRSDAVTLENAISGTGSLTQAGTGTTILTGENTYTGSTSISAGTLQVGNGGTTGSLGTGAVLNNGTLAFSRSDTVEVSNAISGTGSLTHAGTGTTTLSGTNTYSGSTFLNGGRLNVYSASNLGAATGGLIFNGGTLSVQGRLDLANTRAITLNAAGGMLEARSGAGMGIIDVESAISGSGRLTTSGTGVVILDGANTYTGGTTISDVTLQVGNGGTTGSLGAGAVTNNGALSFNRSDTMMVGNVISGSGYLEQRGTGTTILTGANTYTGGTIISAGTLVLEGNVFGFGSPASLGTGAVVNNGALRIAHFSNWTVSNDISGTGSLTNAARTTVLTGANTYSGGTTISAGTLQVGNGGTTGSLGTGAVTNNGTLTINRSDEVTLGNVISGTGHLTQAGTGATILTGINTYSGGTTISAGTLQADRTGSLGTGAVLNHGTLRFAVDRQITVNNDISGSGGLLVTASPVSSPRREITLTGANTYSGETRIGFASLLRIGDGGTTGSLGTGAVINNGDLIFNRSDVITVGNVISGTGFELSHVGSGTVILTGENTYRGLISIGGPTGQAGTLQIGNGGTTGSLGTARVGVAVGRTLAFNRSDTLTVANVISGAGSLRQTGTGTTILTGANTYTGGTTISAGTLRVNGSLASGVTVQSGGTLSGTGRITGGVTNNGTLTPGASIGTLNIVGDYTQGASGVLGIEYQSRGSSIDLLNVTGKATLDGKLRFTALDNTDATGGTFLTATGGITGKFSSVELVGRQSPVTISYGANNASVAVLTANANTTNAVGAGGAQILNSFTDTGFGGPLAATLLLGLDFAPDLGFGSIGASSLRTSFDPMQFGSVLSAAGEPADDDADQTLRISAFGGVGQSEAFAGALGFEHSSQGVAISGSTRTSVEGLRVGGSIGWADGEYTLDQQTGGGKNTALMASVDVDWTAGPYALQAGLFGGDFDTETQRIVVFNGGRDTITGDTSGNQIGAKISGARRLGTLAGWDFVGAYRVDYTRQTIGASTEHGTNPLRLSTPERDLYAIRNEASLMTGRSFELANDQAIDTIFSVGVGNLDQLGSRQFDVMFAGSGARLAVQGDSRDETQANADAQLNWRFSENMALSFGAAGEFGDNAASIARLGFEMKF